MARRAARIDAAGQLEESLRTALLDEIDTALAESRRLASWEQPVRREAVHELRRALKRFRSGAALCRGAVDAEEIRAVQEEVRSTAERLSATRDRDVMLDTIGDVVRALPPEQRRPLHAITAALVAPEKATTASADWEAASASIEAALSRLRGRIEGADLRAVAPDGIADAIARRWRRARRDARVPWDAAHLDRLHDLRKCCQRLAAQLWLVAPLGPRRRIERLSGRLAEVVSAIGEDRDLGLLEERLRDRRAEFPDVRQVDAMLEHARARRAKLLRRARRRAARVLDAKPREIRALVATGRRR